MVELFDVIESTVFVPNMTDVTVVKFDPVMVMGVPPLAGPFAGVTFVTVGAAA